MAASMSTSQDTHIVYIKHEFDTIHAQMHQIGF
jgi:hypothetical protein